jgi:lipid II:glycine glycyltransferase (peptidoglycan interpeptide bridge formation enzyme)
VRVVIGEQADVETFGRLMAVTGVRDGFGIHSPGYYERAYACLARAGMACLFIATYEGQPLAGLMAFACGRKAWYMYGASGNEHRDRMPTYALQWAAMRWARSRGCKTYDLWGVPDEDQETLEAGFAERRDGLWGVYRNKRGFGGHLVRYAGAFDHVYNRPLHWLYCLALRARVRR